MNTMIQRILASASLSLLMASCDSHKTTKSGLSALGIHVTEISGNSIKDISIIREVNGARTEWIASTLDKGHQSVLIQLGLPDNKMRVAIASESSSAASRYEADVINAHPFTIYLSPIDKPGEYTLMETKDDKLPNQSKIILIAK